MGGPVSYQSVWCCDGGALGLLAALAYSMTTFHARFSCSTFEFDDVKMRTQSRSTQEHNFVCVYAVCKSANEDMFLIIIFIFPSKFPPKI